MKSKIMLVATALALLITTAASAQTVKLKANVPFNFIVNRATLPAGEYWVESMDGNGHVLAIRNSDLKVTNLVLSNSCRHLEAAKQSKLIFSRYGNRYFLKQIWVRGTDQGNELPASPREREIAKDFSMQEVVLMAAQR